MRHIEGQDIIKIIIAAFTKLDREIMTIMITACCIAARYSEL